MSELTWYAVRVIAGHRVRPGDEPDAPFVIERKLRQRGFETYLPRKTVYRHSNGITARKRQKREVPRPLLTGWVFVGWATGENRWRELFDCPGVVGVAGAAGRPAPIADASIRQFARRFGGGVLTAHERERFMRSRAEYAPGQSVRVIGGPFDGSVVKVVRVRQRQAKIILPMFGGECEVEIDAAMLEAA